MGVATEFYMCRSSAESKRLHDAPIEVRLRSHLVDESGPTARLDDVGEGNLRRALRDGRVGAAEADVNDRADGVIADDAHLGHLRGRRSAGEDKLDLDFPLATRSDGLGKGVRELGQNDEPSGLADVQLADGDIGSASVLDGDGLQVGLAMASRYK